MPSEFVSRAPSILTFTLLGAACGGSEPSARAPDGETVRTEQGDGPRIMATSEIGGMNEDAVEESFRGSLPNLAECLDEGAERVEFLGGSVSFFLKINSAGRISHAHLEHSTLGHRATEKCMLSALSKKSWPKPVGGEHGLARKSFEFDPPNDVRPPTVWSGSDAAPGLEKLTSDLSDCKNGHSGAFEATFYVGTEGEVLAASVTPPDESGEGAIDCLVGVLESAKFPSPGSWPAKVTLTL